MALHAEKHVVVQLQDGGDPETGKYTLKRWRVTKVSEAGEIEQVELCPDNRTFKAIVLSPVSGDVRVVAEFMEIVG